MAELQITCQFYKSQDEEVDARGRNFNNQISKKKIKNEKEEDPIKLNNKNEGNNLKVNDGEGEEIDNNRYESKQSNKINVDEIAFDEILILFLNVTSLKQVY